MALILSGSSFLDGNPVLFDLDGNPLLGRVKFFESTTSNYAQVYLEYTRENAAANPMITDLHGRLSHQVFFAPGVYRCVCEKFLGDDFADAGTYWDDDSYWQRTDEFYLQFAGDDGESASGVASVDTLSDLKGVYPATGEIVFVAGYYASGDHSGAFYKWVEGSTATADDGAVVSSNTDKYALGKWEMLQPLEMDARLYGVYPSMAAAATTDRMAALAAWSREAARIGVRIQIKQGTYKLTDAASLQFFVPVEISPDGTYFSNDAGEAYTIYFQAGLEFRQRLISDKIDRYASGTANFVFGRGEVHSSWMNTNYWTKVGNPERVVINTSGFILYARTSSHWSGTEFVVEHPTTGTDAIGFDACTFTGAPLFSGNLPSGCSFNSCGSLHTSSLCKTFRTSSMLLSGATTDFCIDTPCFADQTITSASACYGHFNLCGGGSFDFAVEGVTVAMAKRQQVPAGTYGVVVTYPANSPVRADEYGSLTDAATAAVTMGVALDLRGGSYATDLVFTSDIKILNGTDLAAITTTGSVTLEKAIVKRVTCSAGLSMTDSHAAIATANGGAVSIVRSSVDGITADGNSSVYLDSSAVESATFSATEGDFSAKDSTVVFDLYISAMAVAGNFSASGSTFSSKSTTTELSLNLSGTANAADGCSFSNIAINTLTAASEINLDGCSFAGGRVLKAADNDADTVGQTARIRNCTATNSTITGMAAFAITANKLILSGCELPATATVQCGSAEITHNVLGIVTMRTDFARSVTVYYLDGSTSDHAATSITFSNCLQGHVTENRFAGSLTLYGYYPYVSGEERSQNSHNIFGLYIQKNEMIGASTILSGGYFAQTGMPSRAYKYLDFSNNSETWKTVASNKSSNKLLISDNFGGQLEAIPKTVLSTRSCKSYFDDSTPIQPNLFVLANELDSSSSGMSELESSGALQRTMYSACYDYSSNTGFYTLTTDQMYLVRYEMYGGFGEYVEGYSKVGMVNHFGTTDYPPLPM
jgi:hypothetical protein